MLQRLFLENLVLVEASELHFSKGYTVITGETGSGKSILLTAIGLLLGEKSDAAAIRHGEKTGVIEGDFFLPNTPAIATLFDEFSLEKNPSCKIRRELFSSGKSRASIDGCTVPVQFLKRLGSELIEISSQHAYLSLQEEATPQILLDRFARIEQDVAELKTLFETYKSLTAEREKLLQEEALRSVEMERLHAEIQEIETSKIFATDDTALFSRLKELESSKEILHLSSSIIEELEGGKDPLIRRLARLSSKASSILTLSSRFSSCSDLIETASLSLREAAQNFQTTLDHIEFSENERENVEASLKKIDLLKRKYGPTLEDVQRAHTALKERLSLLENREQILENLKNKISLTQTECNAKATLLHERRTEAIPAFIKSIQSYLSLLHMPQAVFEVVTEKTLLHPTGIDKIRFFLSPNIGEKRIEVKDGASGGEMARLFLAIQATMAHLSSIPTIIFDEIDASIGGITATAVGDLLAAIGKERQVLAITHFTQVAAKAKEHMALCKETLSDRTLTKIRRLTTKKELAEEHNRMVGKAR